MAASKQTAANELYANLMDEAKARFACINAALNGRLGVPAAIIREIGFLQLRMLCELVALSSMISHGDFDVAGTRKLVKEYAADRIINQLEALHPNFYPSPVTITITSDIVHLDDRKEEHLTKVELSRLWHRAGDFLHRGSAKKLLSSRSPHQMRFAGKDFTEIAAWARKISVLLEVHKISSIDNRRHLLVVLSDPARGGDVTVAYAESPKPT